MSNTITLNERQFEILSDLLAERLEDINEEIELYEEQPELLTQDLEEGEEVLEIADYEQYRDEIQSLLENHFSN
jgi:uncharacterized protein Yka (UPF0111/DUF47 family)